MKKILIGIGLAAVLSGCISTGLITVFSDDVTFTSNYVENRGALQVAAICDNKNDTQVTLSFRFSGRISNFQSFRVRLKGDTAARPAYESPSFILNPPSPGVSISGQRITVTFGFATGTVPFKNPALMPQALVVNPVVPPVLVPFKKGALNLALQITDSDGSSVGSSTLVDAIPVWDNCP